LNWEAAKVDELSYQIRRVAPSAGWYGAAWQTPSVSNKSVPVWESACFSDIPAFIEALRRYPSALSVKNLYFTHATFKAPDCSRRRNPPQLDRHARNFLATRTLAIDGDVKPGAFATTAECKQTICAMLAEIGLKPSFIVLTSAPLDPSRPVERSGMHIYLTMTRAPSLEDWKAMALDLVAFLKHRGLVFDTGVTTDPVRILRPCGSLNRKIDEVRIARLDLESIHGPDYDLDELKAILARARPPGRDNTNPPPDYSAHVDLAAVASAADYLLDHGHYGPGCYFRLRDLFFGLAQLAHERPELHDGARSLFERIAVSTGRDHAKAMSWFDGAVARAPSYVGQKRTTIASTFYHALHAGWSHASLLDPDQDDALTRAQRRLHHIFDDDDYERSDAARKAERLGACIRDPSVRAALAPTMALLLARDGWDEPVVLNAIEFLAGRRDVGLARGAQRRAAL
jgi:hypothetical protein